MTLERLTEGFFVPPWTRREHEARYGFAARFASNRLVIDCASGEGAGSRSLIRAGARRVLAIDADPAAVLKVPQAAALSAVCSDGSALPVAGGTFELFVALETIEHVADPDRFLAEARRCLKRDGVFICSTPNRLVTNPGIAIDDAPFNPHHLREYAPDELRDALQHHFTQVTLYGQVPKSGSTTEFYRRLAGRTSPRLVARLRQASKLPRLLYDRPLRYRVEPHDSGTFEYIVAVCSGG